MGTGTSTYYRESQSRNAPDTTANYPGACPTMYSLTISYNTLHYIVYIYLPRLYTNYVPMIPPMQRGKVTWPP